MSIVIAVAGKGGTGKTTFCGLLIKHLAEKCKESILAVDADPNSNLNEVLGVELPTTLGDLREDMLAKEKNGGLPGGMTKQKYMEFMFGDALSEQNSYDLLVMGRTQGEGCYCFVNNILSVQIDKYSNNYSYIIVDNEAGLEHISRGTLPQIDIMLILSDCSRRGIQAAWRVKQMAEKLKHKPDVIKLIVNRAPDGKLDAGIVEEIELRNLDLLGVLPDDEAIYRYDNEGLPNSTIPDSSPIKIALNNIYSKLNLKGEISK